MSEPIPEVPRGGPLPKTLMIGGVIALIFGVLDLFNVIVFLSLSAAGKARNVGATPPAVWVFGTLSIGILLLVIALGVRGRRPWARPLMIVYWVAMGVNTMMGWAFQGRVWLFDFGWLCGLLVAILYLYRGGEGAVYYGRLASQEA